VTFFSRLYRIRVAAMRLSTAALQSFIVLTVLMSGVASAHTLRPAVATLDLQESGQLDIQVRTSAEALLAGIGPETADTDDAPTADIYNALRALPSSELAARFDEFVPEFLSKVMLQTFSDSTSNSLSLNYVRIEVPEPGDLELLRDSTIYLQVQLLSDVDSIVWAWPREYGSSVVRFSTAATPEPLTEWLQAGEVSDELPASGAIVPPSIIEVIWNYIGLGFEHILPLGLDHILFVVGLFLLSAHLRPLLWQISAFTLAHTLTLGLSIYGVISLPASVVEPLIALSIAYVGLENCLYSQLKPWRVLLVFCFGLLHGMGFAGVLSEIGLPAGEFLTALLSFNLGVEFGQLTIVALGFLLVGWFRNKSWYRAVIVIPLSLLISAAGLYWTWERVFN
jgi:hydrogenase/urease accessory protein HupE